MINAVIFDMDGIMIDSEPLWEKTERILLARRNIDYSPDYRDKIVGLNQRDSGRLLVDTFDLEETVEDIINERISILTSIYEKELELIPALLPLLERLGEEGYGLAVASSSPLRVVSFVLDMFSLRGHFLAVVSGDSVANGKPHPDIYVHTAETLGVTPAECVAIEDSINGLRSAKGAGMYCIAVPDKRLTPAQFKDADVILGSLREITPETIKSLGDN
ncbi:MAG: HAD family phosphatase [Candidatus Dadabacteria bacterium]|nr:HAD family phosphatase [Candidatus Dadabacteria bacterium]